MKTALLKKGIKVGVKAASIGVDAARMKETLNHTVEDQVTAAKRALKRTRYAAEDWVDETEYRIKQRPFRAVGMMFGIGLGLGLVLGGLVVQKRQKQARCCE